MSDCPECENAGFIYEPVEKPDEAGCEVVEWHRRTCRNWRHQSGPSLEEIAAAIREGREPPHSYLRTERIEIPEDEIPY